MTRAFLAGALLLVACGSPSSSGTGGAGGSGGASGCPNDLPASCPADAATYEATVAPLVEARCGTCHSPGGVSEAVPLTDYADLQARRSAVLNQVYGCRMPPAGATALSASERAALLGWLVCGAPQN